MNYYKLLELSYVGGALRTEGTVVQINDDPAKGGMEPGANLVPCDENGKEIVRRASKRTSSKELADDLA